MKFEEIIALEQELHKKTVRKSKDLLQKYLSADFLEYGSSGKVYQLDDILTRLPAEDGEEQIESGQYKVTELANNCVLINYVSKRVDSDGFAIRSLRTSVWRKEGSDWKMLFHQGTKKI